MSQKSQFFCQFNWQATSPAGTVFPPTFPASGSIPSGNPIGAMAANNVIYSNILDISRMDVAGIEIAWTGTAVGTLEVMASVSGINWAQLTYQPVITDPDDAAGNEFLNTYGIGAKFIMLMYTNNAGTGNLTAYAQLKDLN